MKLLLLSVLLLLFMPTLLPASEVNKVQKATFDFDEATLTWTVDVYSDKDVKLRTEEYTLDLVKGTVARKDGKAFDLPNSAASLLIQKTLNMLDDCAVLTEFHRSGGKVAPTVEKVAGKKI